DTLCNKIKIKNLFIILLWKSLGTVNEKFIGKIIKRLNSGMLLYSDNQILVKLLKYCVKNNEYDKLKELLPHIEQWLMTNVFLKEKREEYRFGMTFTVESLFKSKPIEYELIPMSAKMTDIIVRRLGYFDSKECICNFIADPTVESMELLYQLKKQVPQRTVYSSVGRGGSYGGDLVTPIFLHVVLPEIRFSTDKNYSSFLLGLKKTNLNFFYKYCHFLQDKLNDIFKILNRYIEKDSCNLIIEYLDEEHIWGKDPLG